MKRYRISISQTKDGGVMLGVHRNHKRFREYLTPEEAQTIAYKLMHYAAGQDPQPFFLLSESLA